MPKESYCTKFNGKEATRIVDVDVALLEVWNVVENLKKELAQKDKIIQDLSDKVEELERRVSVNNGLADTAVSFASILKGEAKSQEQKEFRASVLCQLESDRKDICRRECNIIINGLSNSSDSDNNEQVNNILNKLNIDKSCAKKVSMLKKRVNGSLVNLNMCKVQFDTIAI